MTLVSVVVPAYNSARTVAETLDSITAQDWSDLEIVVVDDGSTDDTPQILARHAERDPRIRVVRQRNGGAADARNHGIRVSRGAFIAPCDADDVWHPEKVSRLMARMEELGPGTGYVYSLSRRIDAESRITGQRGMAGYEGATYLRSLVVNFVSNGSAPLLRREAVEDIGGYDTRLRNCEDRLLQTLMARRWRVGCVPLFLTGYRVAGQGKSGNHDRMKRAALAVVRHVVEAYPETPRVAVDAAEAICLTRLGVADARAGMPGAGLRQLAAALRRSPRTAVGTLVYEDITRFAAKVWRLGLARLGIDGEAPAGPYFADADPAEPIGAPHEPTLGGLVRRLVALEEPFFREASRRPAFAFSEAAARAASVAG